MCQGFQIKGPFEKKWTDPDRRKPPVCSKCVKAFPQNSDLIHIRKSLWPAKNVTRHSHSTTTLKYIAVIDLHWKNAFCLLKMCQGFQIKGPFEKDELIHTGESLLIICQGICTTQWLWKHILNWAPLKTTFSCSKCDKAFTWRAH